MAGNDVASEIPLPSTNKICMLRTLPKNKFLVPNLAKIPWNGLGFFFRRVPIDFNWGNFSLLLESEEKECLPKFGVLQWNP